jgi:surfeit locus 1 family protein
VLLTAVRLILTLLSRAANEMSHARLGVASMTRRMIGPLVFGIGGIAVLVWLGVWQLHRLEWKTAILERIEAGLAAEPVPVPAAPEPEADAYLKVEARGRLAPGELHVYTSAPGRGVGYRVIAPLVLDDGRRVLVDRGFVPIEAKDAVRPPGPVTIVGNLAWPRETDRWTSPPDREENLWFARDVAPMAEALGTEPVMVVASASDGPEAPTPMPVTDNIPNDHLGYAITWFGLAVVWAVMTGYLLWRINRRTD